MAKKISVIIPNYNGKELIQKNLPQVIKNCPKCQIIIVDDASTDDSARYIEKNFKDVKLIEQKIRKGFAHSANTGVKESSGELVLLLNSDVSPRQDFLKYAQVHFENEKVFAVGLADYSHENGKVVVRGKGGAKFTKGFLSHFPAKNSAAQSFWVSGGSSLVDRQKFLELGGFDEIYAPFYWEDIDLCYRARKKGYICLFEPKSKVDHFHEEGAIKKHFSPFYIKSISYKNQFIFVWKNISDFDLITGHILWLPYHLFRAAFTLDAAFFLGFLLALLKVPNLILVSRSIGESQLSDKEVLNKFEKP